MKRFLPPLLLFCGTAACFIAAIRFGLCPCDDAFYVLGRPEVTGGLSLDGIRYAFASIELCIWMPLTFLSYMFDHSVGWGTGGMHLQGILWHAADAALLYWLLLRLFRNRAVAFLSALIWAVHPLRVESVVWIASRKDVISTFFFLAALLAWERGSLGALAVSQLLLVLGAMAKPSVLVFPVFALAMDFLVTGRRKPAIVYWASAGLAAVIALEAQTAQTAGGAVAYSALIPLWYRVLNALAAVTVYLGNFVWPDGLAMQCMIRYPDPPRFSVLGAVVLTLVLSGLLAALLPRARRARARGDWDELLRGSAVVNAVGGGLLLFFAALVPFLGISGFGIHAFADRFTLLPCVGLAFVCAAAGVVRPRIGIPVLGAASLLLAARCVHQVGWWRDDETLLLHTLEIDREENVDTQRVLGVYYWNEKHDMERSYAHLSKAMEHAWCDSLRDMLGVSCHFLVEAAYATGRKAEAEDWYYWMGKWDRRQPGNGRSPEYLMADALWNLNSRPVGGLEEAERILAELRQRDPDSYITRNVAYLVARGRGNPDGIREALERCPRPPGIQCSNAWATKALDDFEGKSRSIDNERGKVK